MTVGPFGSRRMLALAQGRPVWWGRWAGSVRWAGSGVLAALALLLLPAVAGAQLQMPDAREMSGIPRPVDDLPDSVISVRVVRGDLSNNIPNQPVDLTVDGKSQTVRTDANGRAEFRNLTPGATATATTTVDGERLESQSFPVPQRGGIRLLLVATDREKEAQAAKEAQAPPVAGQVVIGGDSRIILEPDDETVRVFYLLEVMNTARAPVNPPTPFIFDVPEEAATTSILDGSTKLASASGTRVRVQGPFPPGQTVVQVGFDLPARGGAVEITQAFPAPFEQLAVIAKKVGNAQLVSAQLDRQEEMNAEGETYLVGGGRTLPAGTPLVLSMTGMPYRSTMPRWIALTVSAAMVLIGVWAARRPLDADDRKNERKRLVARREKLFQDLVRLETDQRQGKGVSRYEARREDLLRSLEQIYSALDADDAPPDPADRSNMAAAVGQRRAS